MSEPETADFKIKRLIALKRPLEAERRAQKATVTDTATKRQLASVDRRRRGGEVTFLVKVLILGYVSPMRSVFLGAAATIAFVLAGVAAPAHADTPCALDIALPSVVNNDGSDLTVKYTDSPVGCALDVPFTFDAENPNSPTLLALTNDDDAAATAYATSITATHVTFDMESARAGIYYPTDDTGDFTFSTAATTQVQDKELIGLYAPHNRAYNGTSLYFAADLEKWDPESGAYYGWQGGTAKLQKKSGKHWKTVAVKGSNVNGEAIFHYKGNGTGKFRVVGILVQYVGPVTSVNTVSWAQPHFTNCTAVHKKYSGGIAKTHTTKNTVRHRNGTVSHTRLKGKVKHSTAWYKANSYLDRDHDGVACEKS